MKDTPPEVERLFHDMLMARSPAQRLAMASDMAHLARTMMRARILADNPNATEKQIRREIFLRWYGDDFDPQTRDKILQALDQWYDAHHPPDAP